MTDNIRTLIELSETWNLLSLKSGLTPQFSCRTGVLHYTKLTPL